jgi:formylglycine-generating enzyme required for sulfatase activity
MESMTLPITFVNKEDALDIKSSDMVPIPGGTVNNYTPLWTARIENYLHPSFIFPNFWETPGFLMGRYHVTWELWKLVFDFAEAGGYRFSSIGNQGAEEAQSNTTISNPRPIGNKLHPVTMVSWNDCAVWCNAYSEMEGLEPVYRDVRGNILRDARESVDNLVDSSKIAGKNGYRLPNIAEWEYAARGADPDAPFWNDRYFFGSYDSTKTCWLDRTTTAEVGSLDPNDAGLYDMGGNVGEWGWDQLFGSSNMGNLGTYRPRFSLPFNQGDGFSFSGSAGASLNIYEMYSQGFIYMGLRVVRDLDQGETP